MANLDQTEEPRKGPSLVIQAGVLLALTALAIGGGWFAGANLRKSEPEPPATPKIIVEPVLPGGHGEEEAGHDEGGESEEVKLVPRLVALDPVTTNLAAPADIWVRMELSVIFSSPPAPEMVRQIHQDILAYMRTVTLQQVQGASGFQHLKSDIQERAQIRSNGLATEVVFRTLLFE